MKKTVWEIAEDTNLTYDHDSNEIFIHQDMTGLHKGRMHEVALSRDDLKNLNNATYELIYEILESA